jgi:hypothetical protein
MMNVDDGWVTRMGVARSQNRWRRQVADTRQTARRNQIMAENYADHLRRQRLVARAFEAEAARHRQTSARQSLSQADRARRYQYLDGRMQTRTGGTVTAVR